MKKDGKVREDTNQSDHRFGKPAIEILKEKIKACEGDMFLAYGYVKQLEELQKDERKN